MPGLPAQLIVALQAVTLASCDGTRMLLEYYGYTASGGLGLHSWAYHS